MVVCVPFVLKWFVESHVIESAHNKIDWAVLFKSLWVDRHSRYSNVCSQALKSEFFIQNTKRRFATCT